jgi:DNA-binding response OmpR family regulator
LNILFADNDSEFRDTRTAYLEQAGHRVIAAASPEEAVRVLQTTNIHLALLDVRLREEDDVSDESGVAIAKDPNFSRIPKIILTGYPSLDHIRDVLRSVPGSPPAAIDYLLKKEEPKAMIAAVERAGAGIQINWNLTIHVAERQALALEQIAGLIARETPGLPIEAQAEELGDLLRKLMFNADQITLAELLWHDKGRLALRVLVFSPEMREKQVIVICGLHEMIRLEREAYRKYAPEASNQLAATDDFAETQRFAASVCEIPIDGDEDLKPLAEYYQEQPMRQIQAALEGLTHALAPWHAHQQIAEPAESMGRMYRAKLSLDTAMLEQEVAEGVKKIGRELQEAGLGGLVLDQNRLTVQLPRVRSEYLPNPIPCLTSSGPTSDHITIQIGTTFGALTGYNILVAADGQAWPTDFGYLGRGPVVGDFAAIETMVKFELLDCTNLLELYQFERDLVAPDQLNSRLESGALPSPLEKALSTIRRTRQLAASTCGNAVQPYYFALLFYAAKTLVISKSGIRHSRQELARLAHACISLGVLCDRLKALSVSNGAPQVESKTITIERSTKQVGVRGELVSLSPLEYDLLLYLWEKAELLCARGAVFEAVYRQKYGGTDSDDSQLNMLVTRLRQKIEESPEQPRHLITRRGQGYIFHRDAG